VQLAAARTSPVEDAFTQLPVREHAPARDFSARWQDLLKWSDFDTRRPVAMIDTYSGQHVAWNAQEQISSTQTFIEAEGDEGLDFAGGTSFRSAVLAIALAMAQVLLAGGVFKLAPRARRSNWRVHWRAAVERADPFKRTGDTTAAEAQRTAAVWQAPTPTDPAHDLKASLRELIGDLQRAAAASDQFGPSDRVFGTEGKTRRVTASYGLASYRSPPPTSISDNKARDLTAAHRTLPFGTRVRVTNVATGRSVTVRINDRGPFVRGRIVDVCYSAAETLGLVGLGAAKVKLDVVE